LRTRIAAGREFDSQILDNLGDEPSAESIEWHSNYLSDDQPELRGMDFLIPAERKQWKTYWPDRKTDPLRVGTPTWDAVGQVRSGDGAIEWLLIEAKAHLSELETSPRCFAGVESRRIITTAFQKTRFNMGLIESEQAPVPEAWFAQGCYQIANRLAALNFLLHEINTPAHLAFVYFTGDTFVGRSCPRFKDEWLPLLDRTYRAMELPHQHRFSRRVHRLFVDVATVKS
jgi:hypothetical protein